jgi:hypothetical protein
MVAPSALSPARVPTPGLANAVARREARSAALRWASAPQPHIGQDLKCLQELDDGGLVSEWPRVEGVPRRACLAAMGQDRLGDGSEVATVAVRPRVADVP